MIFRMFAQFEPETKKFLEEDNQTYISNYVSNKANFGIYCFYQF